MLTKTKIRAALKALNQATGIAHVYMDDAQCLGGGTIQYGLSLHGELYLAWDDEDNDKRIVAPIDWWDRDNLIEALDDPMTVISVSHLSAEEMALATDVRH